MNLVKCNAGHYYDGDKYNTCPHCSRENREPGPTVPALEKRDGSMIMCPKGHYYDSAKFTSCPYCEKEGQELDETMPIESKKNTGSLADVVKASKKTVFTDDEATISFSMAKMGTEPVVGWLICIKGEEKGKSFPLKENKNFIGRSSTSDIVISGDNSVSRERHAVIIYEAREKIFIAQPGESRGLYYLNGKVVLNNEKLNPYDILDIGKTRMLFIPLCGEHFCWEDLKEDEE